jgi:chlorobactene glucosyltransferase
MAVPFLLLLPWLLLVVFLLFRARPPRPLPAPLAEGHEPPLVSVVIPARNEERNLGTCLTSLTAARYPRFEIIVVDDQSEDGTAELARTFPRGGAQAIRVVEGRPLPVGWLGKPWACQQGGEEARGEILLFTDADTVHGPDLLSRSVRALVEDEADALSLVGKQVLGSFWEKLVHPRFFILLAARFSALSKPRRRKDWIHAIANGQFIMVTRFAWEGMGGHRAVRGEVVDDLRLAQALVRGGFRLVLRGAEDTFSTRMYQSLGELVAGWAKNVATGSKQVTPDVLRPVAVPALLLLGIVLWILPPAVLVIATLGLINTDLRIWASAATSIGVLFWAAVALRFGINPLFGLLYPVGAAVEAYVFLKSWLRGRDVEWKGRTYRLESGQGEETGPGRGANPP